jgi:hypothetical protein
VYAYNSIFFYAKCHQYVTALYQCHSLPSKTTGNKETRLKDGLNSFLLLSLATQIWVLVSRFNVMRLSLL